MRREAEKAAPACLPLTHAAASSSCSTSTISTAHAGDDPNRDTSSSPLLIAAQIAAFWRGLHSRCGVRHYSRAQSNKSRAPNGIAASPLQGKPGDRSHFRVPTNREQLVVKNLALGAAQFWQAIRQRRCLDRRAILRRWCRRQRTAMATALDRMIGLRLREIREWRNSLAG